MLLPVWAILASTPKLSSGFMKRADKTSSHFPTTAGERSGWEARRVFEQQFRAVYGHGPSRLTSLGYDAAALARALACGTGGEPFSQQATLNPRGFTGVDGVFRFAPSGPVQRGLAVLEGEIG